MIVSYQWALTYSVCVCVCVSGRGRGRDHKKQNMAFQANYTI